MEVSQEKSEISLELFIVEGGTREKGGAKRHQKDTSICARGGKVGWLSAYVNCPQNSTWVCLQPQNQKHTINKISGVIVSL